MSEHIVHCLGCRESWTDRGNAETTRCACTCVESENERWVAMTATKFVEQPPGATVFYATQQPFSFGPAFPVCAVCAAGITEGVMLHAPKCGWMAAIRQDAFDEGRADAIAEVGGTLSPPAIPQPLGIPADVLTEIVEANRRSLAEERRVCLACYDGRCEDCTGGRLTASGALMICVCGHAPAAPAGPGTTDGDPT